MIHSKAVSEYMMGDERKESVYATQKNLECMDVKGSDK